MRILHICSSDLGGGAGIVAYRLCREMQKSGQEVSMLVGKKYSNAAWVHPIVSNRIPWIADKLTGRFVNSLGLHSMFQPSSLSIAEHRLVKNADIVHLHNIHGEYFSLFVLPAINKNTPIVWTFHDMWPITGHCAAYYECDGWKNECKKCLNLSAYPRLTWDSAHYLFKVKKDVYKRLKNIIIACPSQWLYDRVSESPLMHNFDIRQIPNGVDIAVFRPMSKQAARIALQLDADSAIIMFSSRNADDPRKGKPFLENIVNSILDRLRKKITLLCVGQGNFDTLKSIPGVSVRETGFIQSEAILSLCYSAADVFLFPSLGENLPSVLIESMACGTPCVAYNTGGIGEIIQHRENGYLAMPNSSWQLAEGICELLDNRTLYESLVNNGINLARTKFSLAMQVGNYTNLYNALKRH